MARGISQYSGLILERFSDSHKLLANLYVLWADSFTFSAFDTLASFLAAMHDNVEILTIFRQRVIPVKRVHVQGIE